MSLSFANKVRETSTTEDTGTYDLAGAVAGYAGFVAAVGDAAVVTYRAQMGNDWEIGIGTITDAATDTLARTEVLETLVSGTYTKTGASAVNWGAGTKTIDLIGPAQAIGAPAGWFAPHPGMITDDRWYGLVATTTSTAGWTGNYLTLTPIYMPHYSKIEIGVFCSTAEASVDLDLGLYSITDGDPDALLESSTAIDLGTTGIKSFTTTNKYQGWFLAAQNISTATTLQMALVSVGNSQAFTGKQDGTSMHQSAKDLATSLSYASGLPDPFSGSITADSGNPVLIRYRPAT